MLGFAPVSTHPLGQIETRTFIGVDDISVGISVVEMPISYVYQLSGLDVDLGIDVASQNISVVYNFDSPDDLSVPITLGDVRFTWDFQEKLSEQWIDARRFPQSDYTNIGTSLFDLSMAISRASVGIEPETTLFASAEAIEGRALGAITSQSQVLSGGDALQIEKYIQNSQFNQTYIDYIENYMLPYMAERQDLYRQFYNTSGARIKNENLLSVIWTDAAESNKVWNNVS